MFPFGASTPTMFGGASPSSSPFGTSTSSSPFGMTSASNPFGAKPFGSTSFGAQTAPQPFGTTTSAFGAATTPSSSPFGTTSTSPSTPFGGGQSVFGQKPASPFGSFGSTQQTQTSPNPFGSSPFGQTQPAFGSQASFGGASTGAFGQSSPSFTNPFAAASTTTTPVFGQQSSAFGAATSSPAFGTPSSSPAFGGSPFGQSAPVFGSQSSIFGSAPSGFGSGRGSRAVPFNPRSEVEGSVTMKLNSISAMDAYKDKSFEEIRWEDYQAGDKGGPSTSTGAQSVFPSTSFPSPTPSFPASNPNPFTMSSPSFPKSSIFPSTTNATSSFPSFTPSSTPAFNVNTSPTFPSTPSLTTSTMSSFTFPSFTQPQSSMGLSGSTPFSSPTPGTFQPSSSATFQTPSPFPSMSQPSFASGTANTGTANLFNPGARPTQPSTPLFASSPAPSTSLFGPMSNTQPTLSFTPPTNPVASSPAPVSAPFGNLPAMPQMSIGRASGSSPAVQYGISSMPLSEKPAQVRSSSLLTPRHITPRSKVRMHTRRSNMKKENPKTSFFDADEAPVTPKADVSFIPRENPRALFIHQTDQFPTTPVASQRIDVPQERDNGSSRNYPVVDAIVSEKEAERERTPPKVAPKQNGVREHRDMSMTGYRAGEVAIAYEHGADIEALMPKLRSPEYYTEPRLQELAAKERAEPGYCRRVSDFVVGRKGYGHIKFLGETDVRRLDIEGIVQFNKCEVCVYMDESKKPQQGQGLNKPAEVTLLNVKCVDKKTGQAFTEGVEVERFEKKLKKKTEDQGAEFVSYDGLKGQWCFRVEHFSRYGLDESDEDEIVGTSAGQLVPLPDMMEGVENGAGVIEVPAIPLVQEGAYLDEDEDVEVLPSRTPTEALPHSLPAHLKLNPLKMQLLRTSFFPNGEEGSEETVFDSNPFQRLQRPLLKQNFDEPKVVSQTPFKGRPKKQMRLSPYAMWQRSPLVENPKVTVPVSAQVSKKSDSRPGFRLDEQVPISSSTSECVVDAALFMGASFRVGWGPHGVLVHSGSPVGQRSRVLSSILNFERVALDRTVRDAQGKPKENIAKLQFVSPLMLHMNFSRPVAVETESELQLRTFSCSRLQLERICNDYGDLITKQHNVGGLGDADQTVLSHQLMVWQLISVLFSEKEAQGSDEAASESMAELKAHIANIDPETERLARRADFSRWLQASVFHLVQADLDAMQQKDALNEILVLLSGRQVELAVEKAIIEGDVRLACLLSQVPGAVANRQDLLEQVEAWLSEGIDGQLMEEDRLSVYKLLGGIIEEFKDQRKIDWKRFLGLLLWYHMPPEMELPDVIHKFRELVEVEESPLPTPMYVEAGGNPVPRGTFDSAYYLMLLHASDKAEDVNVKAMFSSASNTFDYLDHRAAWHQKSVLQAIGVVEPDDLNVLDMSFASQLLAAGMVHWAVYVVLHISAIPALPKLHEKVIKEIIGQYCEVWSASEAQRKFLEEDLRIPREWLHEALAVYWRYRNEPRKTMEHYMLCSRWQDAHVLFMTQVSPSLFLNLEHGEVWNVASRMEEHKMEIDNWDLGGALYIDFFTLQDTLHDAEMEWKTSACSRFFETLKESQRSWARVPSSKLLKLALTKMGDDIAKLLVSESESDGDGEAGSCRKAAEVLGVALEAPVPDDAQLCRLQAAISTFASFITTAA